MSIDLASFLLELLQIGDPFQVDRVDRDENDAVHIHLAVDKSHRPDRFSTIHSYSDKVWRHLNIMQYECYITLLYIFKNREARRILGLTTTLGYAHFATA